MPNYCRHPPRHTTPTQPYPDPSKPTLPNPLYKSKPTLRLPSPTHTLPTLPRPAPSHPASPHTTLTHHHHHPSQHHTTQYNATQHNTTQQTIQSHHPLLNRKVNVEGQLRLLDCMRDRAAPGSRFLFTSSTATLAPSLPGADAAPNDHTKLLPQNT